MHVLHRKNESVAGTSQQQQRFLCRNGLVDIAAVADEARDVHPRLSVQAENVGNETYVLVTAE